MENEYQIVIFEIENGKQIPKASAKVNFDIAKGICMILNEKMAYNEI
jgi:hypothetical protein